MQPIEVARKLAEFGKTEDACKTYELILRADIDPGPEIRMEAALFVLQFGGDYRCSYQAFLRLHQEKQYADDAFALMTEAFYLPNKKTLRSHYENNVKQLKKYPYLFRDDFPDFEELPVKFYPFDENEYVPYYAAEGRFGTVTDYGEPVISRNFFKNLDDPILAEDVYSQYELEYLNDNVRPSEYVQKDNHIYLHYKNWGEFCSYLQVLNFRTLLIDKKIVFLTEDEIQRYPIDFKEDFGIDYSEYPVKPVGIREIHRLIWHMQLSYHNGGDFFNEIFDNHPNIISSSSFMNDNMEDVLDDIRSTLNDARSWKEVHEVFSNGEWKNMHLIQELYFMRDRTDKDILVAIFCCHKRMQGNPDPASRIAPVIFYQPHFAYVHTHLDAYKMKKAVMTTEQYEAIGKSAVFRNFKYIKSFAPMRRITTSYGGSIRFMDDTAGKRDDDTYYRVTNEVVERVIFRGYLVDDRMRIFKDCIMVRFEDGKLNPKATFTELAKFLDIPYDKALTYCSYAGVRTDRILKQEVYGFDTSSVYKTYDEYACDAERVYLEYFLQEAYRYYGYDFKYYDGGELSLEDITELVEHFDKINYFMRKTMRVYFEDNIVEARDKIKEKAGEQEYKLTVEEEVNILLDKYIQEQAERAISTAKVFMNQVQLVTKDGYPLKLIPKLELDPALLEQPLYR